MKNHLNHPHIDDVERITDEDRKWFEEHPDRQYRLRFSSISEIWEATEFNDDPVAPEVIGFITAVHSVMPGLRVRRHFTLRKITRRPEDLSDKEVESLFNNPDRYRER